MTSDSAVPLARPSFGRAEREAVLEVLESGWVVQGPKVAAFERRFADLVGARHAAAMSSCTTALHAAVTALRLMPGDEVIVPAFTWVATANVVEQSGARPIFCDIRLDTFNLDVARLTALLTPRTVGIIPVHLFGLPADLPPILDFARRHGLWVIEDAACGLGATIRGQHVGTSGDIGCFSFHPRKSITTGEGGMAVTNSHELDATLRSLRDHGSGPISQGARPPSAVMPSFPRLGFNYRMTDVQGALGLAQLGQVEGFLARRREIARRYDGGLRDLGWLRTPAVPDDMEHGYQAYVVLLVGEDRVAGPENGGLRDRFMAHLERLEIGCRPGTHAPALTDYYRSRYGVRPEDVPGAARAEAASVALPIYPGLSDRDVDRVVDAVRTFTPYA